MYERIYRLLQSKLDPERRISILRSSKDPGLAEYLQQMKKRGSTHMEEDGNIYVKIDDAKNVTKGTWLEELAHALQYLKYGNIIMAPRDDDRERKEREVEVAICLLEKADRLKLSDIDLKESKEILQNYGG
jgi:hypothetical protein